MFPVKFPTQSYNYTIQVNSIYSKKVFSKYKFLDLREKSENSEYLDSENSRTWYNFLNISRNLQTPSKISSNLQPRQEKEVLGLIKRL
jgi:hypothetical protein